MGTTLKLSVFTLIFASFSCTKNFEKEIVLLQNKANAAAKLAKSVRKSSIVNTIALRTITKDITRKFMVSFVSENLAERKGWDGTVKGGGFNFVIDQSGTILTELSPDELAPGNPLFLPGNPIGGIIVKGGKNPGGQMRELKTDDNGEADLPAEWIEGEYLIQIESKTQTSEFVLTIGKEKIEEIDAQNMLVNKDGTIRNFYYEEDFQLNSDIAKYLEQKEITIAKGYYRVGQHKWGNVTLSVKKGGKVNGSVIINNGNLRFFEGTNPKGIDCKDFGIACFYNAETGIDKKDILYYVVKPIFEKDVLIGVEVSEGKKGLNAVNVKKGI